MLWYVLGFIATFIVAVIALEIMFAADYTETDQ